MTDETGSNSQRSREQHLRKAFTSIERVANRIDLDVSVINLAESTYEQYLNQREYPINDIEDTAMAVLYVAGKTQGEAIYPEEIVDIDRVTTNKKHLLRRAKEISNLLSLGIEAFYDSSSYIDRYCEELGVSGDVHQRAHEITEICSEAGIAGGKNPGGWAAAAIYLAAIEHDEKIKQSEVAGASNVSEVTIRNRYQEQRDAVRETESLPSNPHALVDWYSDRVGVSDKVRKRTHDILKCGEKKSHPVSASPVWPAAALRRASEEYENAVSKKSLKEPIAVDSEEINAKISDLRSALRSCAEYPYIPENR